MSATKICVGKSDDASGVVWTDGTGVAACGRTDEHKAHTFTQATHANEHGGEACQYGEDCIYAAKPKTFPLDWPGIETWREPERIEHMLKGRVCPMCGDRTVRRVCQDGCKRDWNDAETMRRFTTADDRWTR